jgi:hypothetical protein
MADSNKMKIGAVFAIGTLVWLAANRELVPHWVAIVTLLLLTLVIRLMLQGSS